MTKNRLPGVLSFVNPTVPMTSPVINWVISIFGEMGRMDLWQAYSSGTGPGPVKVAQLICPSDSSVDPVGGLSYAVNLGVYNPLDTSDFNGRLFRNRAAWDPAPTPPKKQTEPDQTITSLKTLTRTVMLSERLMASSWFYAPATQFLPGKFVSESPPIDLSPLAFQWSINGTINPKTGGSVIITDGPISINPVPTGPGLSSNHRGMINVTFFDGHTEKIPETTACWNDPDNPLSGTP